MVFEINKYIIYITNINLVKLKENNMVKLKENNMLYYTLLLIDYIQNCVILLAIPLLFSF